MEEKDSLAVYYGKNFWTAPQGAPAQAVPVDWQFTWAGHLCRIPALYVSDAGLTLDVLLFLDSGAVRTFCKKYAGVDGERLTPLEERMLEGERPIPEASFSPRLINGLPVEPCASSSFTWVPFVRRERPDAAVDAVRAAYASLCLPGDCYVCHRVHAPWPRGMQTAVKSLSLEVAAGPRWMPVGREFAVNEVSAAACAVPFAHPVTGAKHTLYVNELAFLHRGPTPRLPQLEEGWLPVIAYEIVPPLPAGEEPELMETGLPPIECTGPVGVALSDSGPGPHGTKPRAACGWLRGTYGAGRHPCSAWKFSALFLRGVSIFRKQPGFPAGHAELSLLLFGNKKRPVCILPQAGRFLLYASGYSAPDRAHFKSSGRSGRTTPKTRNSAPPKRTPNLYNSDGSSARYDFHCSVHFQTSAGRSRHSSPSAIQTAERIIQYTILRLSLHSVAFLSLPQ